MFTNKNEFFLNFPQLLSLAMLQGTAACKLHIADLWILGFFSSSFPLTVSISVLDNWNETRTRNSGPKASTLLFSQLWIISYFKYLYWPHHSSDIILLKTFNFTLSTEIYPCCHPPGNSEEGLKIVACSISGCTFDPGTKHPHTLQHGRRAEQRRCPGVTLPDGADPLMAVKLFVCGQERRDTLATPKVSSCNFENGYNFKHQLHPSAGMQQFYTQKKGKAGYCIYSLLGASRSVSWT